MLRVGEAQERFFAKVNNSLGQFFIDANLQTYTLSYDPSSDQLKEFITTR
jgi:hypothetical protein